MNDPELYTKRSFIVRAFTKRMLQKYFQLSRSNDAKISVLDIGCGPGYVTRNLLYPLIQGDVKEVIGLDISQEMVDYANNTYGNRLLKFANVDVTKTIPDDYLDRFDLIFSFWTFHWIPDQRQLYSNIFKMLKSNGEMFAVFIAYSQLFDIYSSVWQKEQWIPYVTYTDDRISAFHGSKTPEQDLKDILKQAGYKHVFCVLELFDLEFTNPQEMEELIISLTPEFNQIPTDKQKAFIQDHIIPTKIISENSTKYNLDYKIFAVRGTKV